MSILNAITLVSYRESSNNIKARFSILGMGCVWAAVLGTRGSGSFGVEKEGANSSSSVDSSMGDGWKLDKFSGFWQACWYIRVESIFP